MLEKTLEGMLGRELKRMGCLWLKLVCPGLSGVPDRLVLIPGGKVCFVEMKRPGQHERPLQRAVQKRMRALGFTVFSSVDSVEAFEPVVQYVKEVIAGGNGV